ncbi:MAG: response regulator transcription factor [Phaeodactylibacter sp.]|nr:response regulator transcription factor [Phaeodactylibacter sp.]MCB9296365.1 response regulator transcription factor [Lewinellaceae bacterium]
MKTLKTIIADDHMIFLEGLKTVLRRNIYAQDFQFLIVGEAANGHDLINLLKRQPADLLIFDLNMPQKDGLEVLQFIRHSHMDILTLALTMYESPKIVRSAFKAGVDAYVLKDKGIEALLAGIREIVAGNTYVSDGINPGNGLPRAKARQSRFLASDRFVKKHSLTKRELEILQLITQALSNKEIAKALFISDQTVSVHRKNIMRKLGVSNTAGLVKIAYDNSLV